MEQEIEENQMTSVQEQTSDHPYSHPIELAQVQERVRSKINEIKARCLRYEKAAKLYRNWSVGLRVTTLIAVLFFALATYIFPEPTAQSGVTPESWALFFMLLAGLLVLADQVITGTVSWARKRLGELLTGDVAENLELKSESILLNLPSGPVEQEVLEKIEEAIKVAQTEVQTIEKEELDSWRAGVEAAWGALKDRIASDRDAIRTAYDADKQAARTDEEEAKENKGALIVKLSNAAELGSATLTIDGKESHWEVGTQSRVFAGLPVGHRAVTSCGKLKGGSPFRIEDVVLVKGGTKEVLPLRLPEKE